MLNNSEFIEKFAKKGYTKHDSQIIMNDFLDVIREELINEGSVRFYGFGTFVVKQVKGRKMNSFGGDKETSIPDHMAVKFVPGISLRKLVREGFIRE